MRSKNCLVFFVINLHDKISDFCFILYFYFLKVLGCDCLGLIRYFDANLVDDSGNLSITKNAICMHEEDAGLGWKHTGTYTLILYEHLCWGNSCDSKLRDKTFLFSIFESASFSFDCIFSVLHIHYLCNYSFDLTNFLLYFYYI